MAEVSTETIELEDADQIIEKARQEVELEYGIVVIPDIVKEKLVSYCKNILKNYNSKIACEEMKREIIKFIRGG
ncbi:MAG: hypothetical protein AB1485_07195 [Candidatus Thermoplasmatota archaeon]